MSKVRQDAWSHEDDVLLAETVLHFIREGNTQLKAFDEVGDKLNRTSAACGFRWNAEIRQQYEQAIAVAKKQRKEKKRAITTNKKSNPTRSLLSVLHQPTISYEEVPTEITPATPLIAPTLTMDDVISFLQTMQNEHASTQQLYEENMVLKQENKKLKQEYEQLQHRYAMLTEQQNGIQEDYEALMKIMDRARKLVLFEDNEDRMAPIFKMDKNGNLEIVSN
ncbi:RsfA family transcriptional regulator [Priestia taiwanensis]|uniref:Transcriptional regulator n=1 Tax=Priestia taiwanensis TaxID=1347902 RepID=A0A917AVC9_9BACI|nr:RsfA family transcriptional regulator [Priestia taiwanensis]MBM7363654.1 prespore-specific regulator [Priestia taiwanensis]GGE75215.1 transcriptional regulator [Priestia taiwanensis]